MNTLEKFPALLGMIFATMTAWPATISAQPMPDTATRPAPESLFRFYAGKTEDWGKGAAVYWDSDGTFIAINEAEQSLGSGRWYITKTSRMCYEGKWFWRENLGVSSSKVRMCAGYRVDEDGQLWSRIANNGEWSPGDWFPVAVDTFGEGNSIAQSYRSIANYLKLPGGS
jgi:hypothetical protein